LKGLIWTKEFVLTYLDSVISFYLNLYTCACFTLYPQVIMLTQLCCLCISSPIKPKWLHSSVLSKQTM